MRKSFKHLKGITNLNWPVSLTSDLQRDSLSAWVQYNLALLDGDDSTRHLLCFILCWIYQSESLLGGNRQKAAVKGLFEITVIGADWVVYCDKICARREGTLDL